MNQSKIENVQPEQNLNSEPKADNQQVSLSIANALVGGSTFKPNCEKHKKEVAGISDMKILAEMIGDLHYESLANLLNELEQKLHKDSIFDRAASRTDLSICLWDAAIDVGCAARFIQKAWKVSKPFMK